MTLSIGEGEAAIYDTARVLVAEDNPLNQALVRCYFDEFGCSVDIADDGVEAIRLFQLNRYDIVFMDCQMPNLDGLDATRKIREFEQRRTPLSPAPIIALTANSDDSDRDACLAAGMDAWLTKPFTIEQLRSVLDRWLGVRTSASAIGAIPEKAGAVNPSPSDALTSAPVGNRTIDPAALDAIRVLQSPENPDILATIIETYLEAAARQLDRLAKAAARDDFATISAAAHSLKSSSANVGATNLSEMCRELENASRRGGAERVPSLCKRIDGEFASVRAALEVEVHNNKVDRA